MSQTSNTNKGEGEGEGRMCQDEGFCSNVVSYGYKMYEYGYELEYECEQLMEGGGGGKNTLNQEGQISHWGQYQEVGYHSWERRLFD